MRKLFQSLKISGLFLSLSCVGTTAYGQYAVDTNGMPILNSNPGAVGSLFIDFDGGYWQNIGTVGSYDTDGDGSTFSASEQDDIYKAWHDVKTHFAMFDLNVTTIQPDRLVTPTASVLVSNDFNGGAANGFGFGQNVARGAVNSGAARVRSGVITHELGHIMTLNHQSEYDANGDYVKKYRGADQWGRAPIMGYEETGKFASWQLGQTGNPGQVQDDRAKMVGNMFDVFDQHFPSIAASYTGDGYRQDDHASTIPFHGTLLTKEAGQSAYEVNGSGIIERHGDKDFFKFDWEGGDMNVVVEAERSLASVGPNSLEFASSVRTVVRLIKPNGRWIASRWPSDLADVEETIFKSNLAAGRYYIRVDGAGGYSDLGAYNIRITEGTAGDLAFAAVPEPSSLALLGMGGLMLARRRRR